MIVTTNEVLMIRIKRPKLEWSISFSSLQNVCLVDGGISLSKKGKHQQRMIPCQDFSSAEWLCAQIESAFADFLNK